MNNVKKMKTIYVNLEYLLYDSIKLRVDKVQNFSKKIRTVINKSGIRNSVGLGYNLYAAIDTSLFWQQMPMGKLKNCIGSTAVTVLTEKRLLNHLTEISAETVRPDFAL